MRQQQGHGCILQERPVIDKALVAILKDMFEKPCSTVHGTMARLWDSTIRPLLEASEARTIVEIGCDRGHLTQELVRFAEAKGGMVHAIDPAPRFDPPAMAHCFALHRERSLDALPKIGAFDAVLVDGDHNWHTVIRELKMIDALHQGKELPLILLHDTGWPYGRRDMYFDPESIPLDELHPYERLGMLPDRASLVQDGFQNDQCHARHEGGIKNGVLTAVEDFVQSSTRDVSFLPLTGIYGLGIIASAGMLQQRPALAELLKQLEPTPAMQRHLNAVEDDRIRLAIQWQQQSRTFIAIREENERLRILNHDLQGQCRALAVENHAFQEKAGAYDRIMRSKSWTLTAPVRATERVLRRMLGRERA
jgi:hypothetical protein